MIKTLAIVMMVSFLVFWLFNSLWNARWEECTEINLGIAIINMLEERVSSYNKESLNMKQWEEKVFGDE